MSAGAELSFLAEEGAVIDGEEHAHRRFIDADGGQSLGVFCITDGVSYLKVLQANDGTDVAR